MEDNNQILKVNKLTLNNVKGVSHRKWDFETNPIIYGKNDMGKTTMLESVLGMLTGTGLNQKLWDPRSTRFVGEMVVDLEVEVNGVKHQLSRINNKYKIDGISKNNATYFGTIAGWINTKSYNLQQLMNPNQLLGLDHWKVVRDLIMRTFGDITEEDIQSLETILDYDEEVKAEGRLCEYNTSNVTSKINANNFKITRLDGQIEVASQITKTDVNHGELSQWKNTLESKEKSLKELIEANDTYLVEKHNYDEYIAKRDELNNDLSITNDKISKLVDDLSNQLDDSYICEKCGQEVKLSEEAKSKKSDALLDLHAKHTKDVEVLNVSISELKAVSKPTPIPNYNVSVMNLRNEITELKSNIKAVEINANKKPSTNITELKNTRQELIDEVNLLQNVKLYITERTKIIGDFSIRSIESYFSGYQLSLSHTAVNGKVSPNFEIYDNEVKLDLVNTARKIAIKVDFINTIQKHLGVKLPIIVDGLESILGFVTDAYLIGSRVSEETNIND